MSKSIIDLFKIIDIYYYYSLLTANGNPESASYIRQVIDEARKADGDYDALMTSWNNTWENSRPEDMETFDYKTLQKNFFLLDDLQEGGDQALKKLGSELRIIASEQIICSRYEGDEFVICMLDISKEEADSIFARLVSNMNHEIEFDGKRHTLSISLGAVHSNERKTTKELFNVRTRYYTM